MNLAAIGGPAADIEPRQPGALANRLESCFDLALDISEDVEYLLASNIRRQVTGDLLGRAVEGNDVAAQVGGYQPASHALDDAVIEQPVICKVFCGVRQLDFALTNALGELAGQDRYGKHRDQVE